MLVVTLLDGERFGASLVALPMVMAVQFAFAAGLAYLVAAVHLRFCDAQRLVTMLASHLIPVVYSSSVMPELKPTEPFWWTALCRRPRRTVFGQGRAKTVAGGATGVRQ
ncbi:hypothetical protein Q2941_27870 [Bradyrhizobium sp. UFLA05-153]